MGREEGKVKFWVVLSVRLEMSSCRFNVLPSRFQFLSPRCIRRLPIPTIASFFPVSLYPFAGEERCQPVQSPLLSDRFSRRHSLGKSPFPPIRLLFTTISDVSSNLTSDLPSCRRVCAFPGTEQSCFSFPSVDSPSLLISLDSKLN